MKTISCTDVIYATVVKRGTMIASLCLSGIDSLKELLSRIRRALGSDCGLVTLTLRNGSQGWTDRRSLVF